MPTKPDPVERQVLQLTKEVATLRHTICTLIAWMSQSAVSPLSINDAKTLIALAEDKNR